MNTFYLKFEDESQAVSELSACYPVFEGEIVKQGADYFIKNNKEKVECLIKNIGWRYTPTQIDYKLASDTEIKTMKLTNIVEFGIYDDSKFIKRTVDIDRSSSDVDVFDEKYDNKIDKVIKK